MSYTDKIHVFQMNGASCDRVVNKVTDLGYIAIESCGLSKLVLLDN